MPRMRCIVFCCFLGTIFAIALSSFLSTLSSSLIETDIDEEHRPTRTPQAYPRMDDKPDNIFWIIQISDIHISKYRDLARGPDLQRFCEDYVRLINPELALVTGDLTDAKVSGGIESIQVKEEWITYENLIKRCGSLSKTKFLDLRGNHDCFDVFDFESKNNYFRIHSVQGPALEDKKDYEKSYHHTLAMPFGSYSFIGMDSCSRPGPHRPFNFFGYLDEKQLAHLKTLSTITKGSNHTVWFGHFPTSLIVHDPPILRQIMSHSIAYVCGHLHTLVNFVPKMYTRQKTGQLELELGDWKDNRIFRVMAFDHDLMSFTDAKLGNWPIILITNPKSSQFMSPKNEPIEMIGASTHIRVLVFSPTKIKRVIVFVDSHYEGDAYAVREGYPLYVLRWRPIQYAHSLHRIEVVVWDEKSRNTSVKHHFSVDGTETAFKMLPRLILMPNIYIVGKVCYSVMVFLYVLILTSLRQCLYIRQCYLQGRSWGPAVVNSWLMKVWLAARADASYYILIGSVLYLTFGPWFIGNLLTDISGIVFVWGILIQGHFLPGGITYFYGIFQFLTFTFPLTLILGHILDTRRKHSNRMSVCHHLSLMIPFGLLLFFTIYLTFTEFPRAYGQTALVIGPLRTGCCILLPIAWWLTQRAGLKPILAVNGSVS